MTATVIRGESVIGMVERFDDTITVNFRSDCTDVRVRLSSEDAAELAWRVLWGLTQDGNKWQKALDAVREAQLGTKPKGGKK